MDPKSINKMWLQALERTSHLQNNPERTLPILIDELGQRYGDVVALVSDRECLSYKGLAARANRYARWGLNLDLQPGDVVGLMMPNRPEYLAIWLGITRIGGIVALLNTHLTGASLRHSVTVAQPKHVIVAAEFLNIFSNAMRDVPSKPLVWAHGETVERVPRIDHEIESLPTIPLVLDGRRHVTLSDPALYIYTSGTTGLPKAAHVSHQRLMSWSHWFAGMMDVVPGDRMYNCLPMYHSIGGVVAPASLLVAGGSVVVGEGFSASRFWADIARWDCTIFQYIGELCRYLVAAPETEAEQHHRLRLACGNGLRADVWAAFQNRFRIPRILEFYAGTEHNFSLFNVEGKPGSIGRVPSFLRHRFPVALIKLDPQTDEPIRNAEGHCVRCSAGEPGEAIGKYADDGSSRFEGYTNPFETERKLIRNVFSEGDLWVRSGDLMCIDDKGYFYFVDRLGDTFRWKGENVATTEVSDAISKCPGVLDVCVYGVSVAGAEGRAGMAAIVTDSSFTLDGLHRQLVERLPDYAIPRFLRMADTLAATETFKKKKQDLMREGYDPSLTGDALYARDGDGGGFAPLDSLLFEAIRTGQMRL
ncbi:MAG TPA: long-chain-acyl-CoA synthetase [Beijerinckiaceae bacterium]|nr:long-chain-acyl-CoA synthetase [Beijerinckiaceae bacterium]